MLLQLWYLAVDDFCGRANDQPVSSLGSTTTGCQLLYRYSSLAFKEIGAVGFVSDDMLSFL